MIDAPQGANPPDMSLSERRFLAVDDEKAMLEIVEASLKSAGATLVTKVTSVFAARDAIEQALSRFDAIICDQGMFPTTGLQLLQEVRMGNIQRIGRGACFVMLTASKQSDVVEQAMALDANGYVVKPFDRARLVATVARALKKGIALKAPQVYSAIRLE